MATLAEAKAALARHREALLAVPCVLGVSTSVIEGEPVILVLLRRKPTPDEWLPSYLDSVRVVTRITGEIQPLLERTARWRPAPGGVSVSHPRVTAGTLSAILYLNEKPYIISNSHVIADCGRGEIGDDTIQPGSWDSGESPEDTIGHLSFFEPFKLEEPNLIDFAAAEAIPELVEDIILGLAPAPEIVGVEVFPIEAELEMVAVKSGRSSGVTVGKVISVDATIAIHGYPLGVLMFEDLIMVEGKELLCLGGDSGSAVLTLDGGLLGLLFAGPAEPPHSMYFACKIGNILKVIEQSPAFRPATYTPIAPPRWIIPLTLGGIIVADGVYFGLGRKQ